MSHDWYALLSADQSTQDAVRGSKSWARRQLSAIEVMAPLLLNSNKENGKDNAARHTATWADQEILDAMAYQSPGHEAPWLPRSICLRLTWELIEPFYSGSQSQFDGFDNSISRDTLTGLAVLNTSGAKGMLRGSLRANGHDDLTVQLLGNEQDEDVDFVQGLLQLGDVVFAGLPIPDVIAPHDPRRGIVKLPIGFEVVPAGSTAEWGMQLLERFPYELDMVATLGVLLNQIKELITELGMSAKQTVGYGLGGGIKVEIVLGHAWELTDISGILLQAFDEPQPLKPKSIQWPKYAFLLVDQDTMMMTCSRGDAAEKITLHDVGGKDNWKYGGVLSSWRANDKAKKQWDACKKMLAFLIYNNQKCPADYEGALAEWEARRQAHSRATAKLYSFDTIEEAIKAVSVHLKEVTK